MPDASMLVLVCRSMNRSEVIKNIGGTESTMTLNGCCFEYVVGGRMCQLQCDSGPAASMLSQVQSACLAPECCTNGEAYKTALAKDDEDGYDLTTAVLLTAMLDRADLHRVQFCNGILRWLSVRNHVGTRTPQSWLE